MSSAGLAFVLSLGLAIAPKSVSAFDPITAYGDQLAFDVYRNDTLVGDHLVRFRRDGDVLRVETDFQLKVDFLVFTAYRMTYSATTEWQDGQLISLRADTDENGDLVTVTAKRDGDVLKVTGPKGEFSAPLDTLPTHHWNPRVKAASLIINTITGDVSKVVMQAEGESRIESATGRMIEADHWAYTDGLQNHIWFDAQDRWVGMRFSAEDGSTIEYRCRSCLAAAPES